MLIFLIFLQEMINLREGALLNGTVKKIFPYGAQIRIGETNRRWDADSGGIETDPCAHSY